MWTSCIKERRIIQKVDWIDLAGSTNEVQDPKLILNSLFLTKQAFDEKVDIFKRLSFEMFYNIL